MSNIIEIKNLSFGYEKNIIYDKFSLNIKNRSITHIIDCENNGKTTLAKILSCEVKFDALIKINGKILKQDNILDVQKDIITLYEDSDNLFISNTIRKCIYIVLKSKGIDEASADKRIEKLIKKINITPLLDLNPTEISGGEKQLVSLFVAFLVNPKILILDNSMNMLDSITKSNIYNYLKKLVESGTTIVHFTTNSEDLLQGTDIIILNNGKVILNKETKKAFDDLNIYTKNNIALPFIIELSSKLMYYKAVNKIYFDYKKLVNDLWN